MNETILIVSDSPPFIGQLKQDCYEDGYVSWEAATESETLSLVTMVDPILVVIDLEANCDGLELCHRLREVGYQAVIIVVSEDDSELTCTLTLELGADDYLVKPYRFKEMISRMKVVRRRMIEKLVVQRSVPDDMIENGSYTLIPDQFLFYKDHQVIELTKKEFELIHYLLKHKGEVISRDTLVDALSSDSATIDARIIDVFVSRLRHKIEPEAEKYEVIQTIRGKGYLFTDFEMAYRTHVKRS
ncbi:two-component system alkaline phosphatase synthesis response regulator PhoP/two-component system response regulator VicR [Streptohalobacillus salinus]|uniref:Two-component system alkaline phosphatase synthesis response regulator PhoP/two-component system response regulator VicR n=1 Tax=Streptohalobacillus salinus TaxID=621096 RepID=A0A2V3VX72_9BACI|nr:response regulator transcription factor [Streptohalobacillus salinus]PXW86180.1 two-component system alkaline phosphatase synthesis response regulator PhoP/two-component system response regulator VicR [Streptohalobacillus salinus]